MVACKSLLEITETMLKNILYKAALCLGMSLTLTACSQEESAANHTGNSTGVSLQISLADNVESRATEAGWSGNWKENTIKRLDLYLFSADGKLRAHLVPTLTNNVTELTNGTFYDLTVEGLTYNEVADNPTDVFYLVANCPQLESTNVTMLSDLQATMITSPLVVDAQQESFVMDARTTSDDTELYQVNATAMTATLKFQLYRAAAKIRLTVEDEAGNSILDDCQYQLLNYVSTGTSVLAEEEDYGKKVGQALAKTDPDQPFTLYNDKAIFYSYPNDWFDESLLTEDGVFEDETIYTRDDLIDENRQTYFLLKAPYEGNTYYYKVPVNFSIADYNDKESFTKEEIETLRDNYYRLSRNHLYDITVTIDREGGSLTEPVTPKFHILVEDWKEGGSYEISDGEFQEDSEKSGD